MNDRPKDTLFETNEISEDFVFNSRVVEVFDDMLERSIPFYKNVITITAELLDRFLKPGDTIYDLGCATGTTLLQLARLLPKKNLHFVGLDNSEAMLKKARLKTELYTKQNSISFQLEDITTFNQQNIGGVILQYTLQFIRPLQREAFLHRIFQSLRPGGVLLMSEKVITHDPRLNREYIELYHSFKKKMGYSELEIAKKREALENVLIPFTVGENISMLEKCGFQSVETFFRWFNFVSFICIKPKEDS